MTAEALSRYTATAERTAATVIAQYSTSFGLATKLLAPACRPQIRNIYALVRIADEIVDGVGVESGLTAAEVEAALDAFEAETEAAMASGYSTNLVVHAFATTARQVGIDTGLTRPFFTSMRMDVEQREHTPESFAVYVDGSAEVVGLMCLRAFLSSEHVADADRQVLERGARRLGAAFQKVNFLRDLAADFGSLGRSYFPGVTVDSFTEADKLQLVDDLDDDLAASAAVIPLLPSSSRRAVALAHGLFAELSARIRRTPAERLATTRIRVPDPVKWRILARTAAGRPPRGTR